MKYMGSKARFAKELIPIITANLGDRPYVEPFAGGFNMIDKVAAPGGRYANDYNDYVIAMFSAGVNGWTPPLWVEKDERDDILANPDNYAPETVGWAGIGCGFGGDFCGGFAGKSKTKIGTVRNYQDEARRGFLKQITKLNGVYTRSGSYETMPIPNDAVIYCDPPYVNTTGYKTGDFDTPRFWEWVREVSKKHEVFISEYIAPDDFTCVWEKTTKSSLSANGVGGGAKSSTEKLFKYVF